MRACTQACLHRGAKPRSPTHPDPDDFDVPPEPTCEEYYGSTSTGGGSVGSNGSGPDFGDVPEGSIPGADGGSSNNSGGGNRDGGSSTQNLQADGGCSVSAGPATVVAWPFVAIAAGWVARRRRRRQRSSSGGDRRCRPSLQ